MRKSKITLKQLSIRSFKTSFESYKMEMVKGGTDTYKIEITTISCTAINNCCSYTCPTDTPTCLLPTESNCTGTEF